MFQKEEGILIINRILLLSFLIENLTIFLLADSIIVRSFLVLWLLTSLGIYRFLQPKPILNIHSGDLWKARIECRSIEDKAFAEACKAAIEHSYNKKVSLGITKRGNLYPSYKQSLAKGMHVRKAKDHGEKEE
jgi:hypothetical protein